MILRRSLTLTSTFLGVFASIGLIAGGCSSEGNGGGSGGGGQVSGAGGNPNDYAFCEQISTCPPDVTGVDLTTPVSFKTDINPILFQSCSGGSACHQTTNPTGLAFSAPGAAGKVALDEQAQQALVTQLTTSMSKIAASAPLVTPSNWQNSFLMTKLDGCQNMMGYSCSPTGLETSIVCEDTSGNLYSCGDGMPQSDGTSPTSPVPFPLQGAELTKFRAWIQQGAQFN